MTAADQALADPRARALPAPCWWIDRDDDWEITHHPTRAAAEAAHADRVRSDYGWVLTVAGAFARYPGVARQEMARCYEVTCPECGTTQHIRNRFTGCVQECGFEVFVEQLPPEDPTQIRLFEVLPTHDIAGQPLSRVVVFAEKGTR